MQQCKLLKYATKQRGSWLCALICLTAARAPSACPCGMSTGSALNLPSSRSRSASSCCPPLMECSRRFGYGRITVTGRITVSGRITVIRRIWGSEGRLANHGPITMIRANHGRRIMGVESWVDWCESRWCESPLRGMCENVWARMFGPNATPATE